MDPNFYNSGFNEAISMMQNGQAANNIGMSGIINKKAMPIKKRMLKTNNQDMDDLFNDVGANDDYNNNDNFWQGYESFTSKKLNPFK